MASSLSYKKKLLSKKDFNMIIEHYNNFNLPSKLNNFFNKKDLNKIIYFMQKDKKNLNQKLNLILLKRIGSVTKPNTMFFNKKDVKEILMKSYN